VLGTLKYAPRREEVARKVLRAAKGDGVPSPMLTRESLRGLEWYGIDVGAHTVTHPILARVSTDEAWREICTGKRELEELTGRPVTLFAYPNGKPGRDYADEHVRIVREAGFAAAVTTAWGAAGSASDPFQLPRFTPWTRTPWKFDLLMLRNLRDDFDASRSEQSGEVSAARPSSRAASENVL
jgi:peptidoglycan/xylan/chitin deacetylase (PgdA/CDA1 family)